MLALAQGTMSPVLHVVIIMTFFCIRIYLDKTQLRHTTKSKIYRGSIEYKKTNSKYPPLKINTHIIKVHESNKCLII